MHDWSSCIEENDEAFAVSQQFEDGRKHETIAYQGELTDSDNRFAQKLKIVFHVDDGLKDLYKSFGIDPDATQGNSEWNLPLAATFVIDKKRVIRYAFVDVDYKKRAEPSELIAALEKLISDKKAP